MGRSVIWMGLCAGAVASTSANAAQSCSSLANLALGNNTTITLAARVAAGQFTPPDGSAATVPAFCRVSGVRGRTP